MAKRKAKYTVTLDEKGSEEVLEKIDLMFLKLEKKYPIEVETCG